MLNCRIQLLEQVKDGWHIRFGGDADDFWFMLSNFKNEQRKSQTYTCFYNPKLFNNKGGWYCTDDILKKYAGDFSNYQVVRAQAEQDYQSSGRAEADRRKAEEAKRKAEEARKRWGQKHDTGWGEYTGSGTGYAGYEHEKQQREQREKEWEETERRQKQEQRKPKRVNANLTIEEALTELGLSPIIPLQKLTEKEVKTAFRAKALIVHPDVGGSHEAMVKLNNAYQLVLIFVQKATV